MLFDPIQALPATRCIEPTHGIARQWGGAALVDVVGPAHGEVHQEHTLMMLQRWSTPLEVRLHGETRWQRFLPEARLWLPGEEQRNEWRGSTRNQVVMLTVEHVERVLEQPLHATRIGEWRGRHLDPPPMAELLSAVNAEAPASTLPLAIEATLAKLVDWLARGPGAGVQLRRTSRLTPGRLAQLKDYIEAHFAEPLSLARLAAVAGCSPRLLGGAFKAATARTPHQYVLERRVSEAQLLLRERRGGLSEIAAQVGFADQSQFSNTFRRTTGMTPGAFRQLHGMRLMPARSAA